MEKLSYIIPQSCIEFPLKALLQGYFDSIPWKPFVDKEAKWPSIQALPINATEAQFKKSGEQLMLIIPMEANLELKEPFLLFLLEGKETPQMQVFGLPAALEDWYWEKGFLHIFLGSPEKLKQIKANSYHFEGLWHSFPKLPNAETYNFVAGFEQELLIALEDKHFLKSISWDGEQLPITFLANGMIKIYLPAHLKKGKAFASFGNLAGKELTSTLHISLS